MVNAVKTVREKTNSKDLDSLTDQEWKIKNDEIETSARNENQIPYGVCLFVEEASTHKEDFDLFMKMAKWWVKGEMNEDSFDLFTFHFCEIAEVDYFWVLMEQPGFYYTDSWKEWDGQPTYAELEKELKQIGTRSKKKAKINFKLSI